MAFTFFFRDLQTLSIAIEKMIPLTIGKGKIKIWDAGCASGEEPFTLAIILSENMSQYTFKNVEIHATDLDINNEFKNIIETGIYPFFKLKRIPEDIFKKYFIKYGEDTFQLIKKIKEKMIFKKEDLLSLIPTANDFSLIICKNVLLHQSYDQRIQILKMFHSALAKDGIIVMEHTQKLPKEIQHLYEPLVSNAQIYKKK